MVRQLNLSAGEISPAFGTSVDLQRYQTSLRTCRNCQVKREGGVENRPGTVFIAETSHPGVRVRLVKFRFSADQQYWLEFGDQTMRVIRAGAMVTDLALATTTIQGAGINEVTCPGLAALADGDKIYLSGIVQESWTKVAERLNGLPLMVADLDLVDETFALKRYDGSYLDWTSIGSYTSGAVVNRIYEIATPYADEHVGDLQFEQNADIMIITHELYRTRKLTRTSHSSWTFSNLDFDSVPRPLWGSATAGGVSTGLYRYRICAVAANGEESQPAIKQSPKTITAITLASPPVLTTSAAHDLETGYEVLIQGVVGLGGVNPANGQSVASWLNFRRFIITKVDADEFSLDGVDATTWTAYSSGGTVSLECFPVRSATTPTAVAPHVLTFYRAHNTGEFNIYRSDRDGLYGLIGSVSVNVGSLAAVTFRDIGYTPDLNTTNPMAIYQFENKDGEGYPAACKLAGQRLLLGGFPYDPEVTYASRIGSISAFAPSPNLEDDSPITFRQYSQLVSRVRYYAEKDDIFLFTDAGESIVEGDGGGVITPTSLRVRGNVTRNGSPYGTGYSLTPEVIDNTLIYLQGSGSIIRSMEFTDASGGYEGNDVTIFARHLFKGYSIVSWAYQSAPHSTLWIVRSDGVLIGLTYMKEQQVIGWHRHDTLGTVECVSVIREGGLDTVGIVVARTIGGATVRYIEKLHTRQFTTVDDSCFSDSSSSYDGRNTTASTMTLSNGTWDAGADHLLQASAFALGDRYDNGDVIYLTGPSGDIIACTITRASPPAFVIVQVDKLVPVNMRAVALTSWAGAKKIHYLAPHLEGQGISVLADGEVVASPNNPAYAPMTITNGGVTLTRPAVRVCVGLPYVSDVQTLSLDPEATLSGRKSLINGVTVSLYETRGVFAGSRVPSSDSDLVNFTALSDHPQTEEDPAAETGMAPALLTEQVSVPTEGTWQKEARVFLRQVDPLPMTISGISPQGYIGRN